MMNQISATGVKIGAYLSSIGAGIIAVSKFSLPDTVPGSPQSVATGVGSLLIFVGMILVGRGH